MSGEWVGSQQRAAGVIGHFTGLTAEAQAVVTAFAGGANAALSNLAAVAINANLDPGSDKTIYLGNDSKSFRAAFLRSGAPGDVPFTIEADPSQSGDLIQVLISGGASALMTLESTGKLVLNNAANVGLTINQSGSVVGVLARNGSSGGLGIEAAAAKLHLGTGGSAAGGVDIYTSAASAPIAFRPEGVEAARLDKSAVAGDTRLLIYDVDNAALERVSVGAADSGGAGFKVLRIPN